MALKKFGKFYLYDLLLPNLDSLLTVLMQIGKAWYGMVWYGMVLQTFLPQGIKPNTCSNFPKDLK